MRALTVNRLALGSLAAGRKRYLPLLIGIILALTFSSGMIFLLSSVRESLRELAYSGFGKQTIIEGRVLDENALPEIDKAGGVDGYGYCRVLGYCFVEGRESKGFSAAIFDEDCLEVSRQQIESGRMPERRGEIAVEQSALTMLRIKASPGEKIKLEMNVQDDAGYLPEPVEKEYTLVGILKDKRSNILRYSGYSGVIPAAALSEEELPEPGGRERLCAYIIVHKQLDLSYPPQYVYSPAYMEYDQLHDWKDGAFTCWTDGSWGALDGSVDITDNGFLLEVLAAVLAAASGVWIANTFNTGLQERKRQAGLYRAVGATKRQIVSVFGREILIISLIAAPVSVALSYLMTKAVTALIGGFVFRPKIWILFAGGAFGVAVCMLSGLSSLLGASRVSPMQAIRNVDVIRKLRLKKSVPGKDMSVSKLLAKRASALRRGRTAVVCSLLAFAFALGSLGLSAVKTETDSAKYESHDLRVIASRGQVARGVNLARADGSFGISPDEAEEIACDPYIERLQAAQEYDAVMLPERKSAMLELYGREAAYVQLSGHEDDPRLTEENYRDFIDSYYGTHENEDPVGSRLAKAVGEKTGYGEDMLFGSIQTLTPDQLESLKKRVAYGKIDIAALDAGEEVVIVVPSKAALFYTVDHFDGIDLTGICFDRSYHLDSDGRPQGLRAAARVIGVTENDVRAGDEIDVCLITDIYPGPEGKNANDSQPLSPEAKVYKKKVKIGAVVENKFDVDGIYLSPCCLLTTNSGISAFGVPPYYRQLFIDARGECTREADDSMTKTVEDVLAGSEIYVNSTYRQKQNDKQSLRRILTAAVSIMVLFFSVSAAMVNNAFTADIRESRRKIGTLRAVGADAFELTKSYIRQLVGIFATGLLSGAGLYAAIWAGYLIFARSVGRTPLSFVILPSLAAWLCAFAVCALGLRRQIKKQLRSSIVENIREL